MPSVYRLAMDKIEQSRAMVTGEIWHDAELAMLMDLVLERLEELEQNPECRKPEPETNVIPIENRWKRTPTTHIP